MYNDYIWQLVVIILDDIQNMKNRYKTKFIPKPLTYKERLSEVASLLTVAIRRLHLREDRLKRNFYLDSFDKQSVNPPEQGENHQ